MSCTQLLKGQGHDFSLISLKVFGPPPAGTTSIDDWLHPLFSTSWLHPCGTDFPTMQWSPSYSTLPLTRPNCSLSLCVCMCVCLSLLGLVSVHQVLCLSDGNRFNGTCLKNAKTVTDTQSGIFTLETLLTFRLCIYSIKHLQDLFESPEPSGEGTLIERYMVYTVGWSSALSVCCVHCVSTGMPCGASQGTWTVGGGIVIPTKYIIFGRRSIERKYIFNSRRLWQIAKSESWWQWQVWGRGDD